MMNNERSLRSQSRARLLPLFLALVLHAVVLIFFISSFVFQSNFATKPMQVSIVNATAVNQTKLNVDEMKRNQEILARKQAEEENLRRLQEQKELERQRQQQMAEEEKAQAERIAYEKAAYEKTQAEALLKEQQLKEAQQKKEVQKKLALLKKTQAKKKKAIQNELQEMLSSEDDKDLDKKKEATQKKNTLAKQKTEDHLQKQLADEAQALDAEKSQYLQSMVDKYKALILNAIAQKWLVPDGVDKKLNCRLQIRLAPNGTVLDVRLTQTSGDAALDRSAIAAVYKASPLPVPPDKDAFAEFRVLDLLVKPENVLGA